MDALLPPLDTFAVVELTAPPELNENTVSSKEMATNVVEDVFLPTSSEGAAGDGGAKLPETESDVDLPINESANDGLTVHQLQLKHNYDDLFEPQKNDNLELAVSVASSLLEDDAEIEVRESLDGLLNAVVSDVENHPGDHLTDGDEDAEQVEIAHN
jgi:hypothetical protein